MLHLDNQKIEARSHTAAYSNCIIPMDTLYHIAKHKISYCNCNNPLHATSGGACVCFFLCFKTRFIEKMLGYFYYLNMSILEHLVGKLIQHF